MTRDKKVLIQQLGNLESGKRDTLILKMEEIIEYAKRNMLRGGNGRETASAFQREHAQRRHVLRNPLPLRRPFHLPENRGGRDYSCRRNGS